MIWQKLLSVAALSLLICPVSAQEKGETKPAAGKAEMLEIGGGKIVVEKPAAWKTVPKGQMLEHEFKAPAEGENSARITIMSASGSIDANIERWIGQFDGATKADTKIEKKEVGDTKIHIVEISGTFKESMGGPFAPNAGTKKKENYKMLGAILELKDGAKVFIKATGPKETIADLRDAMVKMLEGLKTK